MQILLLARYGIALQDLLNVISDMPANAFSYVNHFLSTLNLNEEKAPNLMRQDNPHNIFNLNQDGEQKFPVEQVLVNQEVNPFDFIILTNDGEQSVSAQQVPMEEKIDEPDSASDQNDDLIDLESGFPQAPVVASVSNNINNINSRDFNQPHHFFNTNLIRRGNLQQTSYQQGSTASVSTQEESHRLKSQ